MSESARFVLKAATAAAHERVDALFSRFDLTDLGSYGRFLQAQAAAFLDVEKALDEAGVDRVLADWSERRRTPEIRDDLAALGLPLPDATGAPVIATDADILGAAYVLEGSRLGGPCWSVRYRTVCRNLFFLPGTRCFGGRLSQLWTKG